MFGHGDHHHSHHGLGLFGHQQQEPQQQHSSPAPQHGNSHHGHHHLLHHHNDHGHHRDTHVRHENFAHLPAHDHSKVGGHTVTVHRGAYGSHTADGKHHAPLPADAVARQMHSYHPEIQKRAAQVANELAPARITPSTLTGQKRAVLIETGQSGAVQQIQQLLRQRGFNSFLVLTGAQATRSAVLDALNKLVANVSAGASLFFYFKGSTGTTPDKGPVYDEPTGMDETIVLQDGVIIDDDLHDILVRPLPKGVRLTALTDCASSGSVLDLSFTTVIPSANASRDVGGAPGVPVTQDGRQVALAHAMACGKAFLGHDSKAALQELIQAGTAYFGSQQGQQGGAGGSLGSLLGAFLQSQGGQGGGGGGAAPTAGGGGLGGLLGSFMGAQQGSQQQPVSQPEPQFSAPPSTPAPAPTASSAPAGDDDWMTPADMKPSTSNSSVATSAPVAAPASAAPAPAPAAVAEEDDWMTPADMKGRALSRDVGVFQVRTTVSEVVHFYRSGDGFGASNSEGSLTHAFVTVLQRNQSPSFQQLLSEMQATMGGQVPVLATGYQQASMNETFAL